MLKIKANILDQLSSCRKLMLPELSTTNTISTGSSQTSIIGYQKVNYFSTNYVTLISGYLYYFLKIYDFIRYISLNVLNYNYNDYTFVEILFMSVLTYLNKHTKSIEYIMGQF